VKPRLPLYARILGLFLLNVLVIAAAFFVVFRMQFHLGLDSILAGQASQRVRALSEVVIRELREVPEDKAGPVLQRFSEAFGLQLHLFDVSGRQLAGDTIALPPEVERAVRRPLLNRRPEGPLRDPADTRDGQPRELNAPALAPPPDGPPAEPGELQGPPARRLRQRLEEGPGRGLGPGPRGPEGGLRGGLPPAFFLKTTDPTRYWAGTFFLSRPPWGRAQVHVLLIVSDSISGGGLFLDFTPWILAGCGGLLLSALIWLPFVRSITRAVGQMTRTTEEISVGRFGARVTARRSDELGRLSQAINHMAERLEGFVNGQRRFLGDIAHELCSPLARIQTALGILEQRADAKDQPYVKDLQEEAEHMSQLVGELLSFSRASMNQSRVELAPTPLAEVVAGAVRREQVEGVEIRSDVPADLKAQANAELLQRAVANLLRNAIRHAGAAGPIVVSARTDRDDVVLAVTDHGPGVPPESLPKLFDPFYRVDESRTRDTGGVGLGLTIVKTCIESCGGTVSATNRPEGGLCVELRLKRA